MILRDLEREVVKAERQKIMVRTLFPGLAAGAGVSSNANVAKHYLALIGMLLCAGRWNAPCIPSCSIHVPSSAVLDCCQQHVAMPTLCFEAEPFPV